MRRISLDDLPGKRVVFKPDNKCPYRQDFQGRIGVPDGVVFTVDAVWRSSNKLIWLIAPGYGGKSSYGNGRISVEHADFWKWTREVKGVDDGL